MSLFAIWSDHLPNNHPPKLERATPIDKPINPPTFPPLLKALSISFGEAGALVPVLAAFMPNIILSIIGVGLYYRKVYTIC